MKCDCKKFLTKEYSTTGQCIKQFWLFNKFTESQMEKLQQIGLRRVLKKGTPAFLQEDPCDEMFLIKSGRIKLFKINEDGSEITLDFRKPGDMIGENIFSGQECYPMSAWTLEDTITCGFKKKTFNQLILDHPDIGLNVIQSMSIKLSSLTDRLEGMAENYLENRLYSVLSNIAQEHGVRVKGGFAIKFPLTHEDLGFLIGAHRVSISKAMKSLFN